MKRKWIGMWLSLATLAVLLAGCGEAPKGDGSTSTTESSEKSSTSDGTSVVTSGEVQGGKTPVKTPWSPAPYEVADISQPTSTVLRTMSGMLDKRFEPSSGALIPMQELRVSTVGLPYRFQVDVRQQQNFDRTIDPSHVELQLKLVMPTQADDRLSTEDVFEKQVHPLIDAAAALYQANPEELLSLIKLIRQDGRDDNQYMTHKLNYDYPWKDAKTKELSSKISVYARVIEDLEIYGLRYGLESTLGLAREEAEKGYHETIELSIYLDVSKFEGAFAKLADYANDYVSKLMGGAEPLVWAQLGTNNQQTGSNGTIALLKDPKFADKMKDAFYVLYDWNSSTDRVIPAMGEGVQDDLNEKFKVYDTVGEARIAIYDEYLRLLPENAKAEVAPIFVDIVRPMVVKGELDRVNFPPPDLPVKGLYANKGGVSDAMYIWVNAAVKEYRFESQPNVDGYDSTFTVYGWVDQDMNAVMR